MRVAHLNSPMCMRSVFALLAVALTGCHDQSTQPLFRTQDLLDAVTPSVAARISASGEFLFVRDSGIAGEITESRAREIAVAYWRSYESTLRITLARDRGAGIAATLSVCPRAYYAESGVEPVDPDMPQEYRRAFGAVWLVGLCSSTEQQVAVSISAEATSLQIRPDGRLSNAQSGDFFSMGVPRGMAVPALPEYGAVSIAREFGERVSAIPVLQRRGGQTSGLDSYWLVPIESASQAIGVESGSVRTVSVLRFGCYNGCRTPRVVDTDPRSADEPRDQTFRVYLFSDTVYRDFIVTRRADVPAKLEPVIKAL